MDSITTLMFVVLISILVYYIFSRKKFKFPPGPVGYPLLGNSLDVNTGNLHLMLTKWAKMYGDICQVKLFGRNIVVLNCIHAVREAFTVEPNATIFASRQHSVLVDDFLNGGQDIALSTYSKNWSKRRKIGHKILRAYGEGLKHMEESVHGQLEISKARIKDLNGEYFNPEEIINEFLAGVISILLTGRRHETDGGFPRLILAYDKVLNQLFAPEIMFLIDYIPLLRYIPNPIKSLYKEANKLRYQFYQLIYNEKETKQEKGMVHDLYEIMEGSCEDGVLDKDIINAILTNMIGGGILTSKGTLWSAINILIHRNDVQGKLQAEVDRVVGSERTPCLSDKMNMPYTEAFIIETLRFTSHVPLLVPHYVSDDTTLCGYDIQKGSTVLVNAWNIHHNEEVYPDPFDFKPERFLDKDGNLLQADSPQRKSFILFGLGKRSCIGESFARSRLFLFISTVMQTFNFVADDTTQSSMMNPEDMEPFLIRMPKHFMCRAVLRNK